MENQIENKKSYGPLIIIIAILTVMMFGVIYWKHRQEQHNTIQTVKNFNVLPELDREVRQYNLTMQSAQVDLRREQQLGESNKQTTSKLSANAVKTLRTRLHQKLMDDLELALALKKAIKAAPTYANRYKEGELCLPATNIPLPEGAQALRFIQTQ